MSDIEKAEKKLLYTFQNFIHLNNIHCPAVDDIEKMIMVLLEELNHKNKLHENYDKAMLEMKDEISKHKGTINNLSQKLKSKKSKN